MSIVRVPFSLTGGAAAYVPAGAIWLDGSADYFNHVFGPFDSTRQFTFSVWFKRSQFDTHNFLLSAASGGGGKGSININSSKILLNFENNTGSVSDATLITTQVLRDTTAWYHLVIVWDTPNATLGDRIRMYLNGERITAFDTENYPSQNYDSLHIATAVDHDLFSDVANASRTFGGYVSEVIFLDGVAATDATSFGELDANGNWVPIDPSGLTFGTNGFWLDFADSADLGNDVSGNGNDWTLNSMSAANSTSDRPADDAANGIGNYCTLNQLDASIASNVTLTTGNTVLTAPGGNGGTGCTFALTSGKWYWEVKLDNTGYNDGSVSIGFKQILQVANNAFWGDRTLEEGWYAVSGSGKLRNNGATTAYGPDATSEGVVMIALDLDNAKAWWGLNGTWFTNGGVGDPAAGTNAAPTTIAIDGSVPITPGGSAQPSDELTFRFKESEWSYSAPTGFKALSTANLPAPTVIDPSAYFQTVLYTGTGSSNAITGVGFQPDFVFIKRRDGANFGSILDAVRGAANALYPNSTATEATYTSYFTSFDSDGFTLAANTVTDSIFTNVSGQTYVAWCLKAGGAGSSNTDGSITSTVSAAAHGGFSIGTYTGTGASATVGHGLSSAPAMIIVKDRNAANEWSVYHSALGPGKDLQLESSANANTNAALWNNTAPTASVFSVSTIARQNASGNSLVFYAFAKTPGLIGIGSYVGNGSADGPYVVVDDGAAGFRPAWLMTKRIDNIGDWWITDSVRDPYNVVYHQLYADGTGAEETTTDIQTDFTANGFKNRDTSRRNQSGATYIYLAFAEYPFGGDGVAQAKAR